MSGRAIFLGVVIPFVALSALALWLTRDTPAHAVAAPSPPPPVVATPQPLRPARRVAPPPLPPEDEPMVAPPPGTWSQDEVRVALRSVQPWVRECLADAAVRNPGAQTVTLRFTLEAQGERGRFQKSEVVESTLQDPFVLACLLDAFADAQFSAPPGKAPLTLTHPFHFRPR